MQDERGSWRGWCWHWRQNSGGKLPVYATNLRHKIAKDTQSFLTKNRKETEQQKNKKKHEDEEHWTVPQLQKSHKHAQEFVTSVKVSEFFLC